MRVLIAVVIALLLTACRPAAPSGGLSTTPAPDGGPSPAEAATYTAIAIIVLASPTPLPPGAPPPPSATPVPVPTATPMPILRIEPGWKCERNSIGDVVFRGLVRNNTSNRIFSSVRVRGTMSSGSVANDNDSYVQSGALGPGQASEFTIYVKDPGGDSRCSLSIVDWRER
jgi:hypothetical protein